MNEQAKRSWIKVFIWLVLPVIICFIPWICFNLHYRVICSVLMIYLIIMGIWCGCYFRKRSRAFILAGTLTVINYAVLIIVWFATGATEEAHRILFQFYGGSLYGLADHFARIVISQTYLIEYDYAMIKCIFCGPVIMLLLIVIGIPLSIMIKKTIIGQSTHNG